MPKRKVRFVNGYYYHIYNRGAYRQDIFTDDKSYTRFERSLDYYRWANHSLRYSYYHGLNLENQQSYLRKIQTSSQSLIELIAYCLMPNHYHLVVRQEMRGGVLQCLSLLGNSYTRYLNTRKNQKGRLFEGRFQAVMVESDEQLAHLSRYIHLNPLVAGLTEEKNLVEYQYSSLGQYIDNQPRGSLITEPNVVLEQFQSRDDYKRFVFDQIDYARELALGKSMLID